MAVLLTISILKYGAFLPYRLEKLVCSTTFKGYSNLVLIVGRFIVTSSTGTREVKRTELCRRR